MKKEENGIIINKDNYKGYVELYETYHFMTEEEKSLEKNMARRCCKVSIIGLATIMITAAFLSIPALEIMFYIEVGALVSSLIGLTVVYTKKTQDMKK